MHLSRLRVQGLRASVEGPIEVRLPGRFAVIVGANSAGKTTFSDAAYLGHGEVFPSLGRFSSAGLGDGAREIEIEYQLESSGIEGPLGQQILTRYAGMSAGDTAAIWTRTLSRNLGAIRAQWLGAPHDLSKEIKFLYLPASRNPLDELARREARILVELLRAQQQRLNSTRNLTGLRARAWKLLEELSDDPIIVAVEERITAHLITLTAGVAKHWPYVRGQRVDDGYLARVLELMLAVIEGRPYAKPLEVSGLGYVNLLHLAVVLAAIPDAMAVRSWPDAAATSVAPERFSRAAGSVEGGADRRDRADDELKAAEGELVQAVEEARLAEDSFFQESPFHATLIIEEPEAHLHPQLQYRLLRHLRRTVQQRPELQVILSTHAPEVITAAQPEDIVVMRKRPNGRRVSRTIAAIPITAKEDVLRKARLHLDATRSAAIFAERVLLVEGVTEVALIRELARVWAGSDLDRQAFADSLTITAMGTKVGPWPARLLATPDHEICERLAVLTDSDQDITITTEPTAPSWINDHDGRIVRAFLSHPTLEPSLVAGNEALISRALVEIGLVVTDPVTPAEIHRLFQGAKMKNGVQVAPAGKGSRKKGEFALAMAEQITQAIENGDAVTVPRQIADMLDFLYRTDTRNSEADPNTSAAPPDEMSSEQN
ncbi:putative ATP-dependent endonuclease of OLD family [Nocardia kruczakiae]|uniref:ATP-dependent endonuclease of OLD family n=1 Tax=Nocardia kruczakiae TaxID=261477 RepID=A0ABU1XQV8_9NOCA|nr:AAA family ATPase [Nocardia kruczakiae]MDR7172950.1 putative ATP-dependent endonuclease of OLD family [Nocardia kruczakiae]